MVARYLSKVNVKTRTNTLTLTLTLAYRTKTGKSKWSTAIKTDYVRNAVNLFHNGGIIKKHKKEAEVEETNMW